MSDTNKSEFHPAHIPQEVAGNRRRHRRRWDDSGFGVVADGAPGVPGDLEDDERDAEADERVGELEAEGDHGGAGDDAEADEGVDAGVIAVDDQCGTLEAAARAPRR